MNSHVLGASVLLASLAGGVCAQSTFKSYMQDTAQPDFYWPLENSFVSNETPTGYRIDAVGMEKNGIYLNDCGSPVLPPQNYVQTDYFPILPNHITGLGASSALIFGELTGDLAPTAQGAVDRYIEFNHASDMLTEFGMHEKNEWTMHMVVSPADDDETRGWETLFDIGNEDYIHTDGLNKPIRVTLGMIRQETKVRFELKTIAQTVTATAIVEINDADAIVKDGRRWYQVMVQYFENGANNNVEAARLMVNSVESETQSGAVLNEQIQTVTSNQWRHATPSVARIGLDIEDNYPFHGAIQHFAIWKGLLDTEYNVMTEVDALTEAFRANFADSEADQRADLLIDWDQDPRYFFWDVPSKQNTSGSRDLLNWNDPIWSQPNTYPLVRLYYDLPSREPGDIILVDQTIRSYTEPSGQTPKAIAEHTANWIDYIEQGLAHQGKSLSDPNAFALLWQNWGAYAFNDKDDPDCFYEDRNAARGITKNWRDTPAVWRNSPTHAVLSSYSGDNDLNQIAEIEAPFYREGMSQNAFRSRDIFIELKKLIDDSHLATPTGPFTDLATPSRFHFDTEQISNINNSWNGSVSGNNFATGWWDEVVNSDSRADDQSFWTPKRTAYGHDTIAETLENGVPPNTVVYDPTQFTKWSPFNDDWWEKTERFFRNQYDTAFGIGVGLPALEELNPNLRFSEYNMVNTGDELDRQDYPRSKATRIVQHTQLNWLDFSSPVLYPTKTTMIHPTLLFQEWAEHIDDASSGRVHDLLITDDYPNNGKYVATQSEILQDARTIYIERSKYMVNAIYLASGAENGAPQAPWLPYPNETSFKIEGLFNYDVTVVLEWQDIAKVAVFAHRHGVREFIFWGDTGGNVSDIHLTTEGLANITSVVDSIEATTPAGFTTSADFSGLGGGLSGVPDGVIDIWDSYYYVTELLNKGDIAADIAGPYSNYPDGILDSHDLAYFEAIYGASNP